MASPGSRQRLSAEEYCLWATIASSCHDLHCVTTITASHSTHHLHTTRTQDTMSHRTVTATYSVRI